MLSPVDRISEMLFGLLMALTFTGAVSVAESGKAEIRTMFLAALGCNLAWGLVDGVMHLIRTVTERGRLITLVRAVKEARDESAGRAVVEQSLSRVAAGLVSPAEIEAVRSRIVALASLPARPKLGWRDLGVALQIFFIVVVSTFPVVLPFIVLHDVDDGQEHLERDRAGDALSRRARARPLCRLWQLAGRSDMAGLGTALVIAINALGG